MKITTFLVVTGIATAACAQTSVYYLSDSDNDRLNAYQGTVQQWDMPQQFGDEYPIAVVNGEIRTTGTSPGFRGGSYDLFGNYTGGTYPNSTNEMHWDSTSDNASNFLVGWGTNNVYSTDTSYQNPALLFNAAGGDALGITYDGTNNSLWIADFSGGRVTNYDMAGNVLSSFNSGLGNQAALAYDAADDTLWMIQWTAQTAFQYDKAGNLLSSFFDSNMAPNPLGGEMGIPAPGTVAILGISGLLAFRRRR